MATILVVQLAGCVYRWCCSWAYLLSKKAVIQYFNYFTFTFQNVLIDEDQRRTGREKLRHEVNNLRYGWIQRASVIGRA